MGKTQKPLTIVLLPPCDEWEEFVKLEAQGHTIIRVAQGPDSGLQLLIPGADLVLGGNCWRMDVDHRRWLTLSIKEGRMQRYGHGQKLSKKSRDALDAELADAGLPPVVSDDPASDEE